jgi:uncharacterized membrane protein YfcA
MQLPILLLVFIASLVGTTTGFGTSTILVPVLTLWFPFTQVLLFGGVIHWFGNLWKMYFFKKGASLVLLTSFGLFGLIASFVGAQATLALPETLSGKLLGVFLIAYSLFTFTNPKAQLKNTYLNASLGGVLSGLSAGLFGVGGAIRGAFLSAFGLKKAVYLFTAGFMGLIIDSSRLVGYWHSGAGVGQFGWGLLAVSIPVSLAGAWVAKRLVDRIPQTKFRLLILSALLLLGIRYISL